jgi:superfamily II DNA helicase RecQ
MLFENVINKNGQNMQATCTLKIRQRVLKILNMKSTDIREITLSPNRQNIKLTISKVSNEENHFLNAVLCVASMSSPLQMQCM